jgi:hypothetical protein
MRRQGEELTVNFFCCEREGIWEFSSLSLREVFVLKKFANFSGEKFNMLSN